jgi:hypothetical protein
LMLALKMSRMNDVYILKMVCHFLRCPTNVLIQPQIVIMEHTIVWSGEGDQKTGEYLRQRNTPCGQKVGTTKNRLNMLD